MRSSNIKNSGNPLGPVALVAFLTLLFDLYKVIGTRELPGLIVLRGILCGVFLILYVLKSRFAWLASLVLCISVTPAYLVAIYTQSPISFPNVGTVLILSAILIGAAVYVIKVRKEYYSYLEEGG